MRWINRTPEIILSFAFLLAALIVRAVPADPTPYRFVQPDGSVIILQNHGDEFFHWTTDASGQVVQMGTDGFYRPVEINLAAEERKAAMMRSVAYAAWSSFDNPPVTNFGDRKILCIIADFCDQSFTVEDPNSHFSNMLNQTGYSAYGATGSVRDYYVDNSSGQYRPQFDVYGPVTLSHDSEYYELFGVRYAIIEAYGLLKNQIPINDYDTDNDGDIDMVLFYFPGYNQAESGDPDTIWPHQNTGDFGKLGKKNFVRYFCSSEFRGRTGEVPASIGPTCHEFAHSLGLPDFYDTDGSNSGGENIATGVFDLMTRGVYNNNGCRPPYLNAVERNMLGWMPDPEVIVSSGDYTLEAVQNNKAYRIGSAVPGEYFVLESRNASKWDYGLQRGLLVYHIDKSERIIDAAYGYSAAYLWENTNKINNYFSHPCFYLVQASDYPESTGESKAWKYYPFPGLGNVSGYIPIDWTGASAGLSLSNISHNGTVSTFTVTLSSHRVVSGTVKDQAGNALEGALVSLTSSIGPFNAFLPGSISCLTDEAGHYSLVMDNDEAGGNQVLMVQKAGYEPMSFDLTISSLFEQPGHDFTMSRIGEGEFPSFGVSYIKVVNGVPSAMVAAGKSLTKTEWYLDGAPVTVPVALSTLDPGSPHVYMVRLSYYDGTSERVFYEVGQ